MSQFKLQMVETLTEKCVFVDGLTRTGKMLVTPLVSNLKHVEYVNIAVEIENWGLLWRMGFVDSSTAAASIRMALNYFSYERMVGRHLNTRPTDQYSIFKSLNLPSLLQRSVEPDGRGAVEKYRKEGFIPCFVTHDTLPNIEVFLDAHPGLIVINPLRHPVDTVMSWYRRGWGQRYGTDPLAFTPAVATDKVPVPWWAMDKVDEYAAASPLERSVMGVLTAEKTYDDAMKRLGDDATSHVYTLCFEHMAVNPEEELSKLADFLETEIPPEMRTIYARERVPRRIDIAEQRAKLQEIKDGVSAACFDAIVAGSRAYEARFGLPEVV